MRSNSYFLKSGKGTYGKGHKQVTVEDIYINHSTATSNQEGIALDPASPNSVIKIWSGTQRQYDALPRKDSSTLYFISQNPNAL